MAAHCIVCGEEGLVVMMEQQGRFNTAYKRLVEVGVLFPVEMMILRTKGWCNPIGPNKELSLPSGIAINQDCSWLIWTASLDRKSNIYLTMVISTTNIMHDPLPITFQTLKLYYISQVP